MNKGSATLRADGSVAIVVCAADPSVPSANWLETQGHTFGTCCFRWIRPGVPDELLVDGAVHQPRCTLFDDMDKLRAHLATAANS